jgi:DsbC/DsbD-like thiol-disulfide interchange protein
MQTPFGMLIAALIAMGAAVRPIPYAMADELASPWVEGFNNKARLVSGKAQSTAAGVIPKTYAALEIDMSPGFKTYWRNPGEAGGVPPEFDFEGSQNLGGTQVLYPAPHRTKDKAGENIAYKERVTFPIAITPSDPAKPVLLKLKAAYGVCKDICIPAEAEFALTIPADAAASQAISSALQAVPVVVQSKESPDATSARTPALANWRIEKTAGKAKLNLDVIGMDGDDGDAFLFSADGLYMPMTVKAGKNRFEADLTDGASFKELSGKTISVTLTGTKGASETFIQLPNDLATP